MLLLSFLLFVFLLLSQIVLFWERIVVGYLQQKVSQSRSTFISVVSTWIVFTTYWLIVKDFQLFINQISLSILPFGVHFFNTFHKYPWAIFMIKVVLLESTHFEIVLMLLIISLKVLLQISYVLHIFKVYVAHCTSLLDYLPYHIRIVVSLGRGILSIERFICLYGMLQYFWLFLHFEFWWWKFDIFLNFTLYSLFYLLTHPLFFSMQLNYLQFISLLTMKFFLSFEKYALNVNYFLKIFYFFSH